MGIKVIIFLLLSIYIQASNLDSNISKTNIETNKPQKIEQKYVEKKQFSTNSKNKTTIDETKIRNIAKDEYLKNFNQTQLSYQNAIMNFSNNLTFFALIISLIMMAFGYNLLSRFNKIEKDIKESAEYQLGAKFNETVLNLNDRLKKEFDESEAIIGDRLNNKIGQEINKVHMNIQKEFDKIKRTINRKDTDYIKSEILLSINDVNRLKTLSDNLLYSINKILIVELNKNKPNKALAKYNTLFKKYTEITSMQDNIVIKALKELSIGTYKELRNLKETKVYLKALEEYTDNIKLKTEINNFLRTLN